MRGPLMLRSWASYAGPFTLLVATGAVLAAATVLGVSLTDTAGARVATVLPVLVLALVAVPLPATDLARRRRSRTALARVRGAGGSRVLLTTAGPAVVAVFLGGLIGAGATVAGAGLLPAAWETPTSPPAAAVTWTAAAVAAAAVLAAVGAWLVAREPLAAALRAPVRTSRIGPWGPLGGVAIGVLALASVYLARTADSPADAGAVVLAGPGLLGLAAGVLVVRLLPVAGSLAAERRSPGVLLGLRRATAASWSARLRATCAAGVVVVATLSAVVAAGAWAERSEQVRLGAPLQVAMPGTSALETLALTRRLDPDGRWLMAGAVTDDRTEAALRTTWLDLARWDRVAADFLAGTPVRLGDDVAALTDAEPVSVVTGDAVTVTTDEPVTVDLTLLDTDGVVTRSTISAPGSAGVACGAGCVVLTVAASGPTAVTGLDLGDTDLLDLAWTTSDGTPGPPGPLTLDGTATLSPAVSVTAVPVLTAGSPSYDGEPTVVGIAGGQRPATPVGTRDALPIVGGAGVLADLPVALAAAGAQGAGVRSVVLARGDTPPEVLAGLADAGADRPRDAGAPARALGRGAAAELRGRQVLVGAAVLLGVVALLGGARRRRAAVGHDHAALRLLGLAPRHLRTAALVEAAVLGGVTAVAVAVGGLVADLTVVEGGGIVPTGPTLLDPVSAAVPFAVVAGAVGAGVATAVAVLWTSWPRGSRSTPAVLLTEHREVTA